MSRKAVRKLFIGVMIFLPLQYAVVGIVGYYDAEPWPAFVFPGFKSVPVAQGAFETEQKIFEIIPFDEQAEQLEKTPAELFPDIPVSQLSGFMRQNFPADREYNSLSQEATGWIIEQAERSAGVAVQNVSLITKLEYRRFINGEMILDSTSVVNTQTIALEEL